jgi:two-component system, OmpR family, sensor histidine kinase BaeS
MRSKLFLAFFTVIIIALISNFIYEHLIVKDFEDYVNGAKEDKLYWILASVEGSYSDGKWDSVSLHEAVHWATMLGFDLEIFDNNERKLVDTASVMEHLSLSMKRRMESIIDIRSGKGNFESYPLYQEGKEIGTILARELSRVGTITEKEALFKKRGRDFLVMSFIIAGSGALFLAIFFSLFLSLPLNKMKKAVGSMAEGDFSVRIPSVSRDEIGELAERFNFMAEALQREEALRKHLTSNIAHELRTPLTVMKANIEAMIDGVVKNDPEGIENIRIEVEKLIRLVEGIEDITKAEASFFSKKDYSKINLPEFLSNIVTRMKPLAAEKSLDLKLAVNRGLDVLSDPSKLERIIQNILTNAIKNTESGGIWIDYGTEKQMFFIKIRDSGTGIPEDKIPLVFKRFYRGEDSKGIGLGLAIVKELVDVMGGRIELKSKETEGTEFKIWLPLKV